METPHIRNFLARGVATYNNRSCNVTFGGNISLLVPEPVRCKVIPHSESLATGETLPISVHHSTELHGTTEQGKTVWIPNFHITSSNSFFKEDEYPTKTIVWEGTCDLFVEGDFQDLDGDDSGIVCNVFTTPSPLAYTPAIHVTMPDGTIQLDTSSEISKGERKGIQWQTPIGEAEFMNTYQFFDDQKIGLDQATVRLNRCQITLKIQPSKIRSLKELLVNLEGVLQEPLRLISFLSHKRVVWYEAEAKYFKDVGDGKIKSLKATAKRDAWLGYENVNAFGPLGLVDTKSLREGLFQTLLSNYEASPHVKIIHRTINLLLASYERAYFENRYTSTYTAFEGMVYGLDKDRSISYLMKAGQFKKLQEQVKQSIKDAVADENLANSICNKTGELQRRQFVEQLWLSIEKFNLAPIARMIWPLHDLKAELEALIRRRNHYMHQGEMSDYPNYSRDVERLSFFLELWILKLLDCPDDVIKLDSLRILHS